MAPLPTSQLNTEKKYSEQDILLLIKFIVKEFAKIVQKWNITQNPSFGLLGMGQLPQPNLNTLLLSTLLGSQASYMNQSDLMAQSIMQQINPHTILSMLDQNRFNSGVTTPNDRSRKVSVGSQPPTFMAPSISEQRENTDDLKQPEGDAHETKDEVETIHSSEDKTNRHRSISEDTSIPSKKIDLDQAYSILSNNAALNALLKNFSK